MTSPSRFAALLVLTAAIPFAALGQKTVAAEKPFVPEVGQQGKDVVWVPTSHLLVEKMLDMARVTPKDYLLDLGSGDGRLVITAARRGVRALGVEYEEKMVALSKLNAEKAGVAERATFVQADLFETDLRRATVITMFLLPEINLRLRPRILELSPGTRIVSNSFDMGEWGADETVTLKNGDGCDASPCTAYLWIVPARVAGTHKTRLGELTLEQAFQNVKGTLRKGDTDIPVDGKVFGRQVMLIVEGRKVRGLVKGGQLAF